MLSVQADILPDNLVVIVLHVVACTHFDAKPSGISRFQFELLTGLTEIGEFDSFVFLASRADIQSAHLLFERPLSISFRLDDELFPLTNILTNS